LELLWLHRLRHALAIDRFVLFAQPVVELAAGTVVRHKLLIGMLGDDGELFAPDEFMPTAERFGLMATIDRWVLHQACSFAAEGHAIQLELYAGTLVDRDIGACVQRELLACGAPPALVGFAVTASALSAHETLATGFVDLERSLGCSVPLGDLTVFTQLSDRRRVDIDCVNVSAQVISSLLTDPAGERVVAEIVRWAEAAGLGTVAEGVEDQATLEHVHALGVQYAQGDHLGLPVPAREALRPGASLPAVRR
jgi:EAL domain-containing protein (putative c-di-GMP-specific phosphodiesterase class I)